MARACRPAALSLRRPVGDEPKLTPDRVDPDAAKKLLAEAGYPNGFGITLHSTSDRLPNDGPV